ncbi:MAG TPA: DnaA regulatory inactivator Hda [Gammaproteobacteria bacterium]|nr:DnaA regulatory inactivator Hda [Gammaproteobacteria bacterium]
MADDAAGQLPLRLSLRDSATFDNFVDTGNELAVQALGRGRDDSIYLWGPSGCGKSHLLQAVCHASADPGAMYLPLARVTVGPELFAGLESCPAVAIDDLDVIAGEAALETALFHLYNRIRESGGRLILAASRSPVALGMTLPDLVTRLGWGLVFRLHPLDDDGRRRALQLRAERRGFALPDEVADYLLRRHARDMNSLFALLDRLDEASLAAQRRLTIPFVRELLRL